MKTEKVPCPHCKSTSGKFVGFRSWRGYMYYWVCECGANHGHAETKENAYEEWRRHVENMQPKEVV